MGLLEATYEGRRYRNPLDRGSIPEFLSMFEVFGGFPWVSGRRIYPPGPILESVFLCRCSCVQARLHNVVPLVAWASDGTS